MRHLCQQTSAVTGAVGGARPAVVEVDQALDGKTGHSEAGGAIPGRDEADAAGVSIRARIEERCRHRSLGVSGSDEV